MIDKVSNNKNLEPANFHFCLDVQYIIEIFVFRRGHCTKLLFLQFKPNLMGNLGFQELLLLVV